MAASSPSVTGSEPSFNPGQRYVHLYALRMYSFVHNEMTQHTINVTLLHAVQMG
jgi:hypothetical protein